MHLRQTWLSLFWITACTGKFGATTQAPSAPSVAPPTSQIAARFKIARSAPTLLPFETRLRRVATVLGVSTSDPTLEPLRAAHLALGDHDYANSVQADGLWLATRMNAWVRVLLPICQSSVMRTRYPSFPDAYASLAGNAWGRDITPSEVADLTNDISESGAQPDQAYVSVCLSVLSAAEFVYR